MRGGDEVDATTGLSRRDSSGDIAEADADCGGRSELRRSSDDWQAATASISTVGMRTGAVRRERSRPGFRITVVRATGWGAHARRSDTTEGSSTARRTGRVMRRRRGVVNRHQLRHLGDCNQPVVTGIDCTLAEWLSRSFRCTYARRGAEPATASNCERYGPPALRSSADRCPVKVSNDSPAFLSNRHRC